MTDDQDIFPEQFDFEFEGDTPFQVPEDEQWDFYHTANNVEAIPNYGLGLEDHKRASERLDLARKKHELDVERAMLPQRKMYAGCISFISISWLAFIGACVWNSGRQYLIISDSVLIALITTTTINVLGLFYIVARWLFPQRFNKGDENQNNDK